MAIEDDIRNSSRRLREEARRQPVQDRVVDVEEDHTEQLLAALHALGGVEVLVGITKDTNERAEGNIGNAALGYIHETGSPVSNIPARPFLYPGVKGSQDRWIPLLKRAGERALNFDDGGMMSALHAAGLVASTAAQRVIQDGIPPPLRRPRYHPPQPPQPPNEATPLYDSGNLLRSLTYAIERKAS